MLILYHGSDHILQKPLYGYGKADNDYGSGFYTTLDRQKAAEWAVANGGNAAYINTYKIDVEGLKVVNLDNFGILSWIAEIIENRGARDEAALQLGNKLIEKYKVDMTDADIIIGYRADDSYSDIVEAFLHNQLSIDEVDRLFRKGDLGSQFFVKSQLAFDRLQFVEYEFLNGKDYSNMDEVNARKYVSNFLIKRNSQIMTEGYRPQGITAQEAVANTYHYDAQYTYYYIE